MKTQSKHRKTNKALKVLQHLQEHGSITSLEAIELYAATRLSAIIFNLRRRYNIETQYERHIDKYGNDTVYGKYIYHGEI